MTNLTDLWWQLRRTAWNAITFPPTLAAVASNTPSKTFVCPATGHQPGAVSSVTLWTDYVYIGNQREISDWRVALLICAPENHGGKFGHVVWRGGVVERLPREKVEALVALPWCCATNASREEIEFLKRTVNVEIPPKLRAIYH